MGFFSKVKKLWSSPEERAEQALKDYLGEDYEEKPETEAEPAPEPEPEPQPEPQPEEPVIEVEPAQQYEPEAPAEDPVSAPEIIAEPEPVIQTQAPAFATTEAAEEAAEQYIVQEPEPETEIAVEEAMEEPEMVPVGTTYVTDETMEAAAEEYIVSEPEEEIIAEEVNESAAEPEMEPVGSTFATDEAMEAAADEYILDETENEIAAEPVEEISEEQTQTETASEVSAAEEPKASVPVETEVIEPEPAPQPEPQEKPFGPTILEPVMQVEAQPDEDKPQWQRDLTKELQQAEPKLSEWLGLILEGIEEAGDDLWDRLSFLLQALEAPKEESEDFIKRFKDWLEEMDYEYVEEFRSELQYRLALALELEDEEDERSRLFIKLSEGLNKTREQITKRIDSMLSSHTAFDDDFWEEFEEILIMADVGYEASMELVERMKERIRKTGETNPENFKDLLRDELDDIFKVPRRIKAFNPPEVVMMIGVNGVGKTTTIAKLAHRAQMQGRKVLIVAGDTFRAAAIGQLEVWARRVGAGFYAKEEGSDPAAVAYEAIDYAVKNGYDLMLLDTAGRLHNKTNLMEELLKIRRVLGKKHDEAPHRSVLVIDATTGQNALSQTKIFNESIGVDELILTKLDGTAKGGVMIAVTMQHKIPITHVGLGEKMEDLRPFNGEDFAKALLLS